MTRRLLVIALVLIAVPALARVQGRSNANAQRRATGGGASAYVKATGWDSCKLAIWPYTAPEGTASVADNAEGDANNDLSDTNSATRTTTNALDGQALSLASASTQFLSCATATCTELSITNADVTFGCLDVYRATAATQYVAYAYTGTHGYRLKLNSGTAAVEVGRGSTKTSTGTTSLSTATHYSVLGVWDHTAGDELHVVVNGATEGTATNADGYDSVGVTTFNIGSSGSGQYFNGLLDSCFVDDASYTDAEACRESNCFSGSTAAGAPFCMCDGTDPTTYLACSTNTDCRPAGSGNTTAICNSGTCKGLGRCAGSMAACNASCPS